MSLKSNIEMVKEELNSEEKFFEKAVITERFVKKYKNVMIISALVVVSFVIANITYDVNKQAKIDSANMALTELSADKSNSKAVESLKSNSPALYDVWNLSKAIAAKDMLALKELSTSSTMIVGDLATYELAKDSASLDAYASKQDAIYRDLALLQSAVFLMNESKIEEAHQTLAKISAQSSLNTIAQALSHYGVK
ncbi:MAG: hypothetical protein GW906_00610 [Epsilonproteobacteria bacterium]|nr:hypothetical protein [Campylobacterota bacterium]OIO14267.1 MAG: hypothetical protein AUJ81_09770 [Helicobacteraceae bacterium CG1_02_36_14]PIP11182.1 MAG: hypothetical protein COX50_01945 [Sulfurimonas sp. CG23_combo_of_CG06-09_8_20_14_all_36_33]PIS25974.1 MAG: hypothetical protein COT46_04340 [Sulfurimonas sp. CG08_land_8_20_14_0_20_36_33]PIU35615.1 MAG: hypothetical protein COT05_02610 [Sulfurimonas sp. CG07_land_8_20_14_0_80_36_56]PIV04483.1 MAG: hypothetical protein COS56_04715 [Sulfur